MTFSIRFRIARVKDTKRVLVIQSCGEELNEKLRTARFGPTYRLVARRSAKRGVLSMRHLCPSRIGAIVIYVVGIFEALMYS